ncbi:MAG: DsbA family protein [Chloroflexi bacterium]|nr:DsbA family protein [Chloroflexota bacterium]
MTDNLEIVPEIEIDAENDGEDVEFEESSLTFTIKRSYFYAILVPMAFLLGLAMGFVFWGDGIGAQNTTTSQSGNQPQGTARRYDIPISSNDPSLGPDDALVTIIEFSDFECPYCRSHFLEVYPQLLSVYGDQIRYVFKDFPLKSIHPNATPAAEAALCAHEQGAFWAYHDQLFSMELGLSRESYEQYALDLDLDTEAFLECLNEGRYADDVQADYDFAAQFGIRSTPTFFINGVPLIGALPFEQFAQVIDSELAGEN